MFTNLEIANMKIGMIVCPLCGKAICSTVGFDCRKECVNNFIDSGCLQKKQEICKCSHITLRIFFKENYLFDRVYSLKQMVKLVASNSVKSIPKIFLPDDLFEI